MSAEARRRLLLLVWAAFIVVFGVLPTHQALQAVVGEEESLSTVIGHFAEFAVFALLAGLWLSVRAPRLGLVKTAALVLVMTVGLGGAVELVQGPLPYRDMQLSDFATDVAGGVTGLVLFSCVRTRSAWEGRRRTG
jgi:VanZ family protein